MLLGAALEVPIKCMSGQPGIHNYLQQVKMCEFHGNIIFLCIAITIPLISGVVVNLDSLVCSNPPCNQADRNSSLTNEKYVSAFDDCIHFRSSDYAKIQCGTPTTKHVFFCSKNEDDKFCPELINFYTEIPSACSNMLNCTTECKAVLMERFGCCIHLNFSRYVIQSLSYSISYQLMELQELCDITTSDTQCQLALTPPSDAITQHEFDCSVNYYLYWWNRIKLTCEIFPEDTQQIVDTALATTCSTLKATGIRYYAYCDRTRDEWCTRLLSNFSVRSQASQTRRQCSTEDTCSSKCRKSLISLSDSFGCCANTFLLMPESNYSTMQVSFNHFYSCSDKMDIWSHCGLSSPGFCDNPLTLNGSAVMNSDGDSTPGQTGGSSRLLSSCGSILMALVPFVLSYYN